MTSKRDAIPTSDFEAQLLPLIPHMRAYARSLCRDVTEADDLAQEALAKAWKSRDSYEMGTNMKAWTFMILRNQFYSDKRRSWRSAPLDTQVVERTLPAVDDPHSILALDDVRQALAMIPDHQRDALILVGAGGLSYEDAAAIMGVAIGTVKSRVSRARSSLQELLAAGSFGRDGSPASSATSTLLDAAGLVVRRLRDR